tara:strand:+ start:1428 stop:1640 length:213 start_codon:yes stop_codon:yes gene_type:complete
MDRDIKKYLDTLMKEMSKEAKEVRKDYIENPSQMSGSYHHIDESSPYLIDKKDRLITFKSQKNVVKKKKK